jgi:GT2 family glycosyltransferase
MPVMTKIVIIILTFNQREKTLQCLETLYASSPRPYQVVVWDNGSVDETATNTPPTWVLLPVAMRRPNWPLRPSNLPTSSF